MARKYGNQAPLIQEIRIQMGTDLVKQLRVHAAIRDTHVTALVGEIIKEWLTKTPLTLK